MWKIKEFSRLTGISPVALRYYDKMGVIHSKRLENGYRVYDDADLMIMKNLVVLKYAGFTLNDIKILTSLYEEPQGQECNDTANEVLNRNVQEMEERIKLLKQILGVIEEVKPLFENHALYKLNQEKLSKNVDELFHQVADINQKNISSISSRL